MGVAEPIPTLPFCRMVTAVEPAGANATLPVVAEPSTNVCLFVVPKIPVAVRLLAPAAPAETEAVGVPLLTLRNANLAESVAVPPI